MNDMNMDDVLKQAQWEVDLERFEAAVEKEKEKIRNKPEHWFPFKITITRR